MESRRSGPQLSTRHDDDDDELMMMCRSIDTAHFVAES